MKSFKNIAFPLITAAVVLAVLYYLYLQDQPMRENFEDSGGSTFIIMIVVVVVIVGGLMYLGKSDEKGSSSKSPARARTPSRSISVGNSSRKSSSRDNEDNADSSNASRVLGSAPKPVSKSLQAFRNEEAKPVSASLQRFRNEEAAIGKGGRRGNTKKRRASH